MLNTLLVKHSLLRWKVSFETLGRFEAELWIGEVYASPQMLDAWSAACLALGACPWQVREMLTEICFLHGIARTENSCDFAARPRVFLSFPCVELLGFGLLTVVVSLLENPRWAPGLLLVVVFWSGFLRFLYHTHFCGYWVPLGIKVNTETSCHCVWLLRYLCLSQGKLMCLFFPSFSTGKMHKYNVKREMDQE